MTTVDALKNLNERNGFDVTLAFEDMEYVWINLFISAPLYALYTKVWCTFLFRMKARTRFVCHTFVSTVQVYDQLLAGADLKLLARSTVLTEP